jgi:hypothetical protein
VRGDPFLLQQALLNLLDNAIAFRRAGGASKSLCRRHEQRAEVAVRDHGSGAPAYALAQVFDRFYSLPSTASGRKSSGLGLALVREVARLHAGEADFANHSEGGALVRLRLPLPARADFTVASPELHSRFLVRSSRRRTLPVPSTREKLMDKKLLLKLVAIGFMSLLLLVPLALIEDQIRQRSSRQDEVQRGIANSSAGQQTLTGPVLAIHYREQTRAGNQGGPRHGSPQDHPALCRADLPPAGRDASA